MIFGKLTITPTAVITHRDSYLLHNITVVSDRRPFLAGGVMFSTGIAGFTWSFAALLYRHEILWLSIAAIICLIVGVSIGQLQLLSRDLRGSELMCAVFGTYRHLNRSRAEITEAMRAANAPAAALVLTPNEQRHG